MPEWLSLQHGVCLWVQVLCGICLKSEFLSLCRRTGTFMPSWLVSYPFPYSIPAYGLTGAHCPYA